MQNPRLRRFLENVALNNSSFRHANIEWVLVKGLFESIWCFFMSGGMG